MFNTNENAMVIVAFHNSVECRAKSCYLKKMGMSIAQQSKSDLSCNWLLKLISTTLDIGLGHLSVIEPWFVVSGNASYCYDVL